MCFSMQQSLKLLSDMAAIRLDEKPDQIERVLDLSLVNKTSAATSSQYTDREASVDPLASSTWEEVLYCV
jgi:protein SEY1